MNVSYHAFLYREDLPSTPHGVTVVTEDYTTENFSIHLSWVGQDSDVYEISTNTTYHINTTMTTHKLEGNYNVPLEINITATNCAGTSRDVAVLVHEGMY